MSTPVPLLSISSPASIPALPGAVTAKVVSPLTMLALHAWFSTQTTVPCPVPQVTLVVRLLFVGSCVRSLPGGPLKSLACLPTTDHVYVAPHGFGTVAARPGTIELARRS